MNLVRMMGTLYANNALKGRFKSTIEMAISSNERLDIAEVKFGPVCGNIMHDNIGISINGERLFYDSADPKRDAILEFNYNAANTVEEEYPPLTEQSTKREVLQELVETLPQGAQYFIPPKTFTKRDYAFLTLLILQRPDIEFDITVCADGLFRFIRNEWLLTGNQKKYRTYIEVVDSTLVERTVDITRSIRLDNGMAEPVNVFISNHNCLPGIFGKQPIEILGNGDASGEFATVFKKCWDMLDIPKPKTPKIEDVLSFRRLTNDA